MGLPCQVLIYLLVSVRTCCRDILRCETKKAFEKKYEERKELWVLPGYIEYFEKHILKGIDRSGLWTAREHGWKVSSLLVLFVWLFCWLFLGKGAKRNH